MKNTNFISKNLLRLPMHLYLKSKDVIKICNEINFFFKEFINEK